MDILPSRSVDDRFVLAFEGFALAHGIDATVASGQESFVRAQVEAMRRAWQALDQAARADGAKPLSSDVWEIALPTNGEVIALVRDGAHVADATLDRLVFTLPEVARLIETLGSTVLETKRVFPGAVCNDPTHRDSMIDVIGYAAFLSEVAP